MLKENQKKLIRLIENERRKKIEEDNKNISIEVRNKMNKYLRERRNQYEK